MSPSVREHLARAMVGPLVTIWLIRTCRVASAPGGPLWIALEIAAMPLFVVVAAFAPLAWIMPWPGDGGGEGGEGGSGDDGPRDDDGGGGLCLELEPELEEACR